MKKDILFTINNLDTAGMKYVLASIVKGIDRSLFRPVIIVYSKTQSALEVELEKICEVREMKLRNPGIRSYFSTLYNNVKSLKKFNAIAHSFDYSSDWYEGLTMKFAGVPYIAEKTNLSISSYRWKLKFALADHIVCLSKAQATLLKNFKNKTTIIPTGINISGFEKPTSLKREEVGIDVNDVVFISVAHLVEVKGYEELIDAIYSLRDAFQNLKIICVGKGTAEYESKLKGLISKKGLSNYFYFAGNVESVNDWLNISDIKILATQNRGRKEAFGAAIVEAMAAGLPVLATKSGGPEDIVVPEETGWLVNGDGSSSLAEGIRKAMIDRDKWKTMGRKGQLRANELYNEKLMIDRYSELYSKLISEHQTK